MGYKAKESDIAYKLNYHYAMYKNEPVYLVAKDKENSQSVYNREYELWAQKVGKEGEELIKIDVTEPSFSAALLQAGYCSDSRGNLAFLQLRLGSLETTWTSLSWSAIPKKSSKELYNCFMGIHPSFNEAVEILKKFRRPTAFHRDFALSKTSGYSDIEIHYKGAMIGTFDIKSRKISLRRGPTVKLLKRKLDKIIGE